ncbi:hypothetical protein GQX73_g5001 [Xylaria multiplex]|uniref:Isopropylmalate dehydrogenase-like domain-containing protein n=1 Tax=Xylaria multiplex TaxID=323545 RepID=A0A7C8IV00_9PEZI|nr:hypothetical protein GQX73_g5001 [Xylaria multiplex]
MTIRDPPEMVLKFLVQRSCRPTLPILDTPTYTHPAMSRNELGQYVNVRPIRLLPGLTSPLKDIKDGPLDWVMVRENSEGEYAGQGGTTHDNTPYTVANDVAVFTRVGIERTMRFAFELAASRPRRKLTMVTKSNAQRHGMVLWGKVFHELAPQYPQVETDKMLVDAMTVRMVLKPQTLDTIVATNLHGDILSDLAAALAGSIGVAPSSSLNPTKEFPSLFEPIHGSAPDIAGKGIASPVAAFWSAAEMMRWLGEAEAADCLMAAIHTVLAKGVKTRDLGGEASTETVTRAMIDAIKGNLINGNRADPFLSDARRRCIDSAVAIAELLRIYESQYTFRRINVQAVGMTCSAALLLIFATVTGYQRPPESKELKAHLAVCSRALEEFAQAWENAKRNRGFLVLLQRNWESRSRLANKNRRPSANKRSVDFTAVFILWDVVEFIVIIVRRSIAKGIHPAFHIVVELILWLGGVATVTAQALSADWSQIAGPAWSLKNTGSYAWAYVALTQFSFLSLLGALRFVFFVRACVEVDRRKKDRRLQELVFAIQEQGRDPQEIPLSTFRKARELDHVSSSTVLKALSTSTSTRSTTITSHSSTVAPETPRAAPEERDFAHKYNFTIATVPELLESGIHPEDARNQKVLIETFPR